MATTTNKPQTNDRVTRSTLRYFGGKWVIAPWIISHMPEHRVYVEPFGGAGSVLLRKPRSRIEVYNDLDEEIVGIFRILQEPVKCQQLVRMLRRTPYSRREFERAQRTIVRAYMSFHHEALFNPKKTTFSDARHRKGEHCKAHEWATYPRNLVNICRRLQGVIIENRDALEVIRSQDTPTTLFFVDPPYLPSTRSKSGYRYEMSEQGHVDLLERLCSIQGRAVVAGYPSELYDDMLKGWQRLQRKHYAAGSQKARTEVLWINPAKPA